ncbi:MAG TPA: Na/Pi symporter [Paracoccus sp. (in: a-proteobacteria)]|uniref:Na/Pi symporter n=1 Tax=Paracoccus sp. TaxID=267 RepID=UPI002BB55012|nr:Na/Pi symporter [Paracoccus sp. (in: a-proteobacteria)]HWL56992.1 Na/Pi symporter [Paracoccus sp. (in: a-proteobacteria)]
MASTIQLIDLLGAVALLLWGLDLIKTGVLAAFGAGLRQWLARGTRNRFSAAFWGFMATLGLQSSTATAVLIASFTARDLVRPRMAQAMMLGANLGTAVVTVILSSDLHWLGSVLIFLGVWLSKGSGAEKTRAIGRAVLWHIRPEGSHIAGSRRAPNHCGAPTARSCRGISHRSISRMK